MKKQKRFLCSFLSFCMLMALTLTMLPQGVYAADDATADVKYVRDESGNRTGIESIDLKGVTYYDIAQGKGTTSAVDGNQINFYKQVLKNEAPDANKNTGYPGTSNQLKQWAELAEKLFATNPFYSADNIEANPDSDYYTKASNFTPAVIAKADFFSGNFDTGWGEAGYTDVSKALSATDDKDIEAGTEGKHGDNYTVVTGLRYANSLEQVRQGSTDDVIDMITSETVDRTWLIEQAYQENPNIIFEYAGDNSMKALDDDTKQDVLYTRVTCVYKNGECYHYNTYVLAFYDFQLEPIAANGFEYINSAEGYDSIEAAQAAGATGVSYDTTSVKHGAASVYENKSQESNNVSLSLSESNSESISTTLSSSNSYSYSTTLGWSVGVETSWSFIEDLWSAKISASHSGSVTTGSVISTGTSDSESVSTSVSENVSSSLTLPAQTAATIESYSGTTNVALDYNCPVAVNYKVAVSSMSGSISTTKEDVLNDRSFECYYKTFNTTFGGSSEDESSSGSSSSLVTAADSARADLYDRTVTYRDANGYEAATGDTLGQCNNSENATGCAAKTTIHTVDWDKIMGEEDTASDGADTSSESTYDDTDQVLDQPTMRSIVKWLGVNNPLSATGGTLKYAVQSTTSSVGKILPIYPLKKVRMDNNENIGDLVAGKSGSDTIAGTYVDANMLLDLTIYPGDKFLTRNVSLTGLNENAVEYYGFKYNWGTWKQVKKDADGNWVEDTSESNVASLKTDDVSGNQYVEAGDEEGTYYIQYFIDEDKYNTSENQDVYAVNSTVKRPVIRLNVRKAAFEGKVTLNGNYTGTVNADAVNLSDELNVMITDEDGNKIKQDYVWEASQEKGITLTSDGNVTFQKEGTYQVRIYSEGKYSDWVDITAKNQADSIRVSGTYITVLGDSAKNLNNQLSVTITDTTGKEITQDYTWDVKELNGISVSADGNVKATKAGTYHVRVVNAAGQYSAWTAITVKNPGITLNKSATTLTLGASASLTATVTPSNAQKKSVTWSSSNANVSVSKTGVITANKTGSAVITVKNAYGKTATCKVKVIKPTMVTKLTKSGKAIKVSWTKVNGASGYEIYATYCDGTYHLQKRTSSAVLSTKLTKLNGSSLKKSCYKMYVKAYKMVSGKKVYIATSRIAHIQYKTSKKYANVTKVTLTGNGNLKVGNSVKLKAKVKIAKKRTQLKHDSAIRYQSTNPNVATVDKNGKVTAKAAGTCYVYAIAVDGVSSTIKITVK